MRIFELQNEFIYSEITLNKVFENCDFICIQSFKFTTFSYLAISVFDYLLIQLSFLLII